MNAQALIDRIYFSLNSLVDEAQIRTFEDMYRALDDHVSYLLPFIGLQFNNYNVQGMISYIRILQNNLEDKLYTFYQNLSEQEQSKVIFSLPQFQNPLFINAINRSIIISNNISVNHGMKNNSFVEKCTSNVATDQNFVFNPFCTLCPKR